MFPWDKNTILQAVGIFGHPFSRARHQRKMAAADMWGHSGSKGHSGSAVLGFCLSELSSGFVSWWANPLKSVAICNSSDIATGRHTGETPRNTVALMRQSMCRAISHLRLFAPTCEHSFFSSVFYFCCLNKHLLLKYLETVWFHFTLLVLSILTWSNGNLDLE